MTRRGNGFGSLINKGEGRPWLARWVYKGQVHYKSTGERDKRRALKELERITRPFRDAREEDAIRNLQNKLIELQARRSKAELPVGDIWTEFAKKLRNDDVEGGTARNYETAVGMLAEWLDGKVKNAGDVTRGLAESYLEHLGETVGASTYNIRLVLFKRVWKALGGEFQLCADAWEGFKKKKAVKTARRVLSEAELAALIAAADTPDMKLLLLIGIYTGMRISDCSVLKWEDVDFERGVIRVVPIKTRKHMDAPIEVPIHPALRKALEEAPRVGEYVSASNARDYAAGRASDKAAEVFKRCKMETSRKVDGKTRLVCGFHSLRHTFVSMAIDAGMSPLLVQRIVGHSAVNMTEHYFHDNAAKAAEGINALPDVANAAG